MTKASARPLKGSTSHDLMAGEVRVATQHPKRFCGLLSGLSQTQTNVWGLYRSAVRVQAQGSPSVSPRIALAVGLGADLRDTGRDDGRGMREAPFPLPPTVSGAGVPPNFSSTFCGICKLAN